MSKGFLKQIEVKIIGKNARRFDRTSVIIKLNSEDKILACFNTPFCTFLYFTYSYFLVLYLYVCKIFSSL